MQMDYRVREQRHHPFTFLALHDVNDDNENFTQDAVSFIAVVETPLEGSPIITRWKMRTLYL